MTTQAQKKTKLDAEVITIGDELNRGEIIDTNSSWLAERLTAIGLHVRYRSCVTDDTPDMIDALRRAAGRADVVLCSGGLGPTDDDRTVDVACGLLGLEAIEEPKHAEIMRRRFAERNYTFTPNNLRQVRIPKGAEVLRNPTGLAPGFTVSGIPDLAGQPTRTRISFMPGPPREMRPMFDENLAPALATLVGDAMQTAKRTFRIAGVGESHVDHALRGPHGRRAGCHAPLSHRLPREPRHARRASPVEGRSRSRARTPQRRGRAPPRQPDLRPRRRDLGDGGRQSARRPRPNAGPRRVVHGRHDRRARDGSAGRVALVQGRGGRVLVRAQDRAARRRPAHARNRGRGVRGGRASDGRRRARIRLGTDWAVAITGVAGPDGGTPDKPVGTVWIAVAGPPELGGTREKKLFWPGDREQVRRMASVTALHLLYKALAGIPDESRSKRSKDTPS